MNRWPIGEALSLWCYRLGHNWSQSVTEGTYVYLDSGVTDRQTCHSCVTGWVTTSPMAVTQGRPVTLMLQTGSQPVPRLLLKAGLSLLCYRLGHNQSHVCYARQVCLSGATDWVTTSPSQLLKALMSIWILVLQTGRPVTLVLQARSQPVPWLLLKADLSLLCYRLDHNQSHVCYSRQACHSCVTDWITTSPKTVIQGRPVTLVLQTGSQPVQRLLLKAGLSLLCYRLGHNQSHDCYSRQAYHSCVTVWVTTSPKTVTQGRPITLVLQTGSQPVQRLLFKAGLSLLCYRLGHNQSHFCYARQVCHSYVTDWVTTSPTSVTQGRSVTLMLQTGSQPVPQGRPVTLMLQIVSQPIPHLLLKAGLSLLCYRLCHNQSHICYSRQACHSYVTDCVTTNPTSVTQGRPVTLMLQIVSQPIPHLLLKSGLSLWWY